MADTTRAKAALLDNWCILESSNLYHNKDGRDAVYALYLYKEKDDAKPTDSAYRVRSDWGRRNAMLQTTLKPAFPTTYPRARSIYDTLRQEKLREGYQINASLTPRLMSGGGVNGSYEIASVSMLRKDNPASAFICPKCKAPFDKESEYLGHMEWHDRQLEAALRETQKRQASGVRSDGFSPTGLYLCSVCRQRYRTQTLLSIHMAQQHRAVDADVGVAGDISTRVKCPTCGTICADGNDFARHYRVVHIEKQARALRSGDIAQPDEKPSLTRKPTRKIILDD